MLPGFTRGFKWKDVAVCARILGLSSRHRRGGCDVSCGEVEAFPDNEGFYVNEVGGDRL